MSKIIKQGLKATASHRASSTLGWKSRVLPYVVGRLWAVRVASAATLGGLCGSTDSTGVWEAGESVE